MLFISKAFWILARDRGGYVIDFKVGQSFGEPQPATLISHRPLTREPRSRKM
jgi:hypothetical protein